MKFTFQIRLVKLGHCLLVKGGSKEQPNKSLWGFKGTVLSGKLQHWQLFNTQNNSHISEFPQKGSHPPRKHYSRSRNHPIISDAVTRKNEQSKPAREQTGAKLTKKLTQPSLTPTQQEWHMLYPVGHCVLFALHFLFIWKYLSYIFILPV